MDESGKEANSVMKFITGIALLYAVTSAISWGWNKLTGND